jgi:hypothetical protein
VDFEAIKFWMLFGFQVINAAATILVWLFVRYGDRNKDIDARFENLSSDFDLRMDEQDKRIARISGLVERAPTHADLSDLYNKVNSTARDVAQIAGELKGLNENLRMILSQIAAKGMQ